MIEQLKNLPAWLRWAAAVLTILASTLATLIAVVDQAAPQLPPMPTPTVSATVPAPLPPSTGVEAPEMVGPSTAATDPAVVTPDAGTGAGVHVEPGVEPGIGGEVFVASPAYAGRQRLNAGFWYPSGNLHGAWDIGILRGTPLFAAKDGVIINAADGVKNHPVGGRFAIPGSPSNWVLLCSTVQGRPASLYYQHLSPGLKVKREPHATPATATSSANTPAPPTPPNTSGPPSPLPSPCPVVNPSEDPRPVTGRDRNVTGQTRESPG